MSTTPKTPASQPSPGSVKERLERLQRELAQVRASTQSAATWTLIIGVLLVVLMGGYFAYGYSEIIKLTKADALINYADQQLTDQLPEARRFLTEQIVANAPQWAEHLSQQGLDYLPTGCRKFEELAMERYEISLEELGTLTDEQFKGYINANRTMLQKHFKELADKPDLAEASLAELQASLETQLQTDMRVSAKELLSTLIAANAKLRRLVLNKDLSPEQQNERRVAMVARHIELKYLNPDALVNLPVANTVKPIGKTVAKPGTAPAVKPSVPAGSGKDKAGEGKDAKKAAAPEAAGKGKGKEK